MYGADWCGMCIRSKRVLEKMKVPYEYVTKGDGRKEAKAIAGRQNIPVIQFPDGSYLQEPSDQALEKKIAELKLGLEREEGMYSGLPNVNA